MTKADGGTPGAAPVGRSVHSRSGVRRRFPEGRLGLFAWAARVACLAALASGCGSGDTTATSVSVTAPGTGSTVAQTSEPTTTGSSEPAPSTTPGQSCGVTLGAPAVQEAIAQLPPEPLTGQSWYTDPRSFEGNFDPCATLSTVIVTIEGATGSSPNHALMFHHGTYLGTATEKAYGFTALDPATTTDDTVGLTYKTPGSCNACDDGTTTQVQFRWDGNRVQMIGNPPPA